MNVIRRAVVDRVFISTVVFSVCLGACGGQGDDFPFEDYESMRARFGELYQQDSLIEAADLVEAALPRFPDHMDANAFNLAFLRGRLGETSKGLEALNFALDRGVWFNIYGFGSPAFEPYRELDGFETVVARNDSLRLVAQASSVSGLKVVLPAEYSTEREYPLFIALHGGSGNMEAFSEVWKSDLLSEEFIVAYVQSSLPVSMTGYSWTQDLEASRREITEAYHRLVNEYPIDGDEVVVGGFSAGGIAALEVMLGNDFPMAGFVVLCPPRPESFTEQTVIQARNRGVRGTILTTEMDPNVEVQREMAGILESTRFPHEFIVTPDVGHWIPDNLGEMIDGAIVLIRGGEI